MNEVTMLELRRDAEAVIRRVQSGERLVLTYRGKRVVRLLPVNSTDLSPDDPIYRLTELAVEDEQLDNEEIDRIVLGI